jgi:hypothetical protein
VKPLEEVKSEDEYGDENAHNSGRSSVVKGKNSKKDGTVVNNLFKGSELS